MRNYLFLLFFIFSACTARNNTFHYEPGARTVSLWSGEEIPLEPDWRYVRSDTFSVRGKLWNSFLPITDTMESMLFTRTVDGVSEVMLISRVHKTNTTNTFIFLGGEKATLGNCQYRHAQYRLQADTVDPEYSRYIAALRAAGVQNAPSYLVHVWDRLPLDTVLTRVMHLRPGMSSALLPSYAQLYPQERDEPILRIRD